MSLYLMAAFAWFGHHCGSGFASVRQIWLYAAKCRKIGIFISFIVWAVCSVFLYITCEYARSIKAKSYGEIIGIYGVDYTAFKRVVKML